MTGSDLKRRRLAADMTQTELAHLAGYAGPASVSRWERGDRTMAAQMVASLEWAFWSAGRLAESAARKGGGA